jgi:hypothetical protein
MKKLLFALELLLPAIGFAQQYSIDWYTIAGGGGASSNGQYVVSGTIGQPDPGTMNGGNYSLTGGFWSLLAVVQTPGAPLLTIHLTATNSAVISWPVSSPEFNLQKNSALGTANWGGVTNVPTVVGGQNQVIIAPPAGNWFYRLKYP